MGEVVKLLNCQFYSKFKLVRKISHMRYEMRKVKTQFPLNTLICVLFSPLISLSHIQSMYSHRKKYCELLSALELVHPPRSFPLPNS